MIRLEVLQGQNKGTVAEVPGTVLTIGRASTNHLVLNDWHISSEHGRIAREGSDYVYRDLHSTNGSAVLRDAKRIVVGGAEMPTCPLLDGDRLLLGDASAPVIISFSLKPDPLPADPPSGRHSLEPARTVKGISFEEVQKAVLGETSQVIAVKTLDELAAARDKLEKDPSGVATLYQATKRLAGRLELNEVLEAITEAVFAVVPRATHVAILLTEVDGGESERFVPVIARERGASADGDGKVGKVNAEIPISRAVLRRVLADRSAVLAANAPEELGGSESIMGAKILSTMGIPLGPTEGNAPPRGVIQVDNRGTAGLFKERDLELCGVLATQASLAIENARLFARVRLAQERATKENRYLKGREEKRRFADIIGKSGAMQRVFRQLEKVIDTRVTVCIEGETGTGKELIASAIHYQGNRRDKLFVAQNCAALPETLLESELFGHKRGAFTGADHDKKGLFEIADGGTLFLDEIGEMGLNLQAKLLRVLQEGEIRPLGGSQTRSIDVRIICATNRDLEKEVEKGTFRQDLFYRLKVFPINLPPLRERREDIPLLAQHFLQKYMSELKKPLAGFTQQAVDQLAAYNWPGNIRELENEIQRLVIQGDPDSFILPENLSPRIRKVENLLDRIAPKKGTLKEMMEEVEKWLLAEALREHGQNKTKTAETLGITREGLHKKLARYGLQ